MIEDRDILAGIEDGSSNGRGEKEGESQTELVNGHGAGDPDSEVAHQTSQHVHDHQSDTGTGQVQLTGAMQTPRVYMPLKHRCIPEYDICHKGVEKYPEQGIQETWKRLYMIKGKCCDTF